MKKTPILIIAIAAVVLFSGCVQEPDNGTTSNNANGNATSDTNDTNAGYRSGVPTGGISGNGGIGPSGVSETENCFEMALNGQEMMPYIAYSSVSGGELSISADFGSVDQPYEMKSKLIITIGDFPGTEGTYPFDFLTKRIRKLRYMDYSDVNGSLVLTSYNSAKGSGFDLTVAGTFSANIGECCDDAYEYDMIPAGALSGKFRLFFTGISGGIYTIDNKC